MKISKRAIAALFAAGFVTTSATAGFAEDKPAISGDCVEGYYAVYNEDGFVSCELDVPVDISEIKPIDSCWVTEDGIDVCARGAMVPMPLTVEEPSIEPAVEPAIEPYVEPAIEPYVEPADCTVITGDNETVCYADAVPFTTGEEGEVSEPVDGEVDESLIRDVVDETLMYQSGVAMPAAGSESNSSNMLAAFGVLVAALGALGIGISRQKEAK